MSRLCIFCSMCVEFVNVNIIECSFVSVSNDSVLVNIEPNTVSFLLLPSNVICDC